MMLILALNAACASAEGKTSVNPPRVFRFDEVSLILGHTDSRHDQFYRDECTISFATGEVRVVQADESDERTATASFDREVLQQILLELYQSDFFVLSGDFDRRTSVRFLDTGEVVETTELFPHAWNHHLTVKIGEFSHDVSYTLKGAPPARLHQFVQGLECRILTLIPEIEAYQFNLDDCDLSPEGESEKVPPPE